VRHELYGRLGAVQEVRLVVGRVEVRADEEVGEERVSKEVTEVRIP
jgi:hypothetical protein